MLNKQKEELKKIILKNDRICNHMDIYKMIDTGLFDYLIEKIPSQTVKCDPKIFNKSELTENEQFLYLLDNFIYFFDNQFYFLRNKDIALTFIFSNKSNGLYLITNDSWDDNNNVHIFLHAMKQTIVRNFYLMLLETYKDSKKIKKYLKSQKIDIENFNFSSSKEINNLYAAFRDLCITESPTNNVVHLFEYIEPQNKKIKNYDEYYIQLLNIMKTRLEIAIDRFNKNILMIEYFQQK